MFFSLVILNSDFQDKFETPDIVLGYICSKTWKRDEKASSRELNDKCMDTDTLSL